MMIYKMTKIWWMFYQTLTLWCAMSSSKDQMQLLLLINIFDFSYDDQPMLNNQDAFEK
jgi:hypothetical protein